MITIDHTMKKTLILLSAVIALCAFTSCNKETKNEHPLEGVWGFMSYEVTTKDADGTILKQEKTEFNPFNPSKPGDMKVEITWVSGNDYTSTSFGWNHMDNKWDSDGRSIAISIRDGNKFFTSGLNGELQETATITISGDTFILDGIRAKVSEGIFDEDPTPGVSDYIKETYKRMN